MFTDDKHWARSARAIPEMPRLFIALGWLFVVVLVVQFVLFAIGYYTLTAVELVVGILIFGWITLFVLNAAAVQRDSRSGSEHLQT
jgi:hypothetical protein